MNKQILKQALAAVFLLALSGGTLAGCLQTKGGNTNSINRVEAERKEIDPLEWYEAVQWQSAEVVRVLLERGSDPDQIFFNGETALHLAVEKGDQKLAELLLAYGADVNSQERKEGFTPLMYAAIMDDRKMMQFLVSHGADPTAPDVDGYTTYHYLAARDNQAAAQLIAGSAPVPLELPTKDGLTVADIASLSKKSSRITLAYAGQN